MGLESGDVIIAVEGRPVERLSLEEVVALIRGEEGEKVALTVRRGEAILNFTLVREKVRLPAVEYSWEGDGLALVRIHNFGGEAAREMEMALEELQTKGLRGLVLDLRGNQGGYLGEALEMASLFSGGVLLQVRDSSYAGWQPISAPEESHRPYPIVILVNGATASAAEIFSAALKDNRKALLVGEVSFGKGTMQSIFELEHGGYLKLTVAEFASPRGHRIEGMGVEPHFLVPSGEEQLGLALQLLRYRLQQEKEEGAFWGVLQKIQERQGKTLSSLEIDGETYLPLRAVLLLTGRSIQAGSEPWLYTFLWENRLYQLDTHKQAITWKPEGKAGRLYQKVFISGGVTYVPQGFLEEELGLGVL
jgi:carboxyl-terminal processing protease